MASRTTSTGRPVVDAGEDMDAPRAMTSEHHSMRAPRTRAVLASDANVVWLEAAFYARQS